MIIQEKFRTLEKLLQSWNPNLYIEELPNDPDCDRVMYRINRDQSKYICAIPKGGKYRSWLNMMAEYKSDSYETTDAQFQSDQRMKVKHRGMDGLVLTLIRKGVINWDASKSYFGGSDLGKKIQNKL